LWDGEGQRLSAKGSKAQTEIAPLTGPIIGLIWLERSPGLPARAHSQHRLRRL